MIAYVLINCVPGSENNIITELKRLPEVTEINGIWGKYDIFVKISSKEIHGIDSLVEKIRSYKEITSSDTMHVLYGQGGTIED